MDQSDINYRIMSCLDRHMAIQYCQFLQERKLYSLKDLHAARFQLCMQTKMVDEAAEEYKKLHSTVAPAQAEEFAQLNNKVRMQMAESSKACGPLLNVVKDAELVKELSEHKEFNMDHLKKAYQVTEDNLTGLYRYAKLMFECGQYRETADYLTLFRVLSKDEEKNFWSLWGRLCAEILLENWEAAVDALNILRDGINRRGVLDRAERLRRREEASTDLELLQHRTWLLHWSLFVFLNIEGGRGYLVEFFLNEQLMNSVQVNAPYLVRYLAAAGIMHKKKKNFLKDIVRVLVQEREVYSDALTEFLRALYVDFDFDLAHEKLSQCKKLIENDFFLRRLSGEFMESARSLLFETYCRIHKTISIPVLAAKMDLTGPQADGKELKADDVERRLLELIRTTRVDAKIDSERNLLIMDKQFPTAYQQVIDKTKGVTYKTQQMAGSVEGRYRSQDRE